MRVAVVDDDASARRLLLTYLKAEADIEVVCALRGGPDTAATVLRLAPEALFLDVQLRDLDGFQLLSALDPATLPKVVFVTAAPEFAVKAFEMGAVDYLLKPVEPKRLAEALQRVRTVLQRKDEGGRVIASLEQMLRDRLGPAANGHATRYLERLMVNERGRLYFLKVSEIDWLEAVDNYVRIHTGRVSHLVRETLSGLQGQLDPDRFLRIHRSAIVNLDCVREIQLGVGRDRIVVLQSGSHLRLSERYRRELERRTRAGGPVSGPNP